MEIPFTEHTHVHGWSLGPILGTREMAENLIILHNGQTGLGSTSLLLLWVADTEGGSVVGNCWKKDLYPMLEKFFAQ